MDNSFGRGPHNPLAEDIVVVDEASMVDLAMMRQLLEALRPEAVLILLGDPGQLASVDAGSVLADIVAGAPRNRLPPALAGLLAPLLQRAARHRVRGRRRWPARYSRLPTAGAPAAACSAASRHCATRPTRPGWMPC